MKNLTIAAIVCMILSGAAGSVPAAPASPVEVTAIDINPEAVDIGLQPSIVARVGRTKAELPEEPAAFTVIAVVTLPDKITKSWTVQKVPIGRGESKEFLLPKIFDTKLAGTYRIEYNVYSADMRKRFTSRSKTFTVGAVVPARPEEPKAPPVSVRKEAPLRPAAERNVLGIGIYGNALNPAGGGTLLYWPFEHVGLQASYTVGTFTISEARLLARFGRVLGLKPYIGVGYLNVTTDENVIGVSTEFKDSSISGVVGAEVPLGRRWSGYAEVSGASIDLEEIVTNGGQTVKATVDYAPVTICVGIAYFFF